MNEEEIRFGLFYQLNKNNEYILLYALSEKDRSVDQWIEIFSTNVLFMTVGRHSLWVVDEQNNRISKIIDNHEIKNLLDSDKPLKKYLVLRAIKNDLKNKKKIKLKKI